MSVKWTEKQLEAINYDGENILVSAAAGSGKTAVLVERIIRKITDESNPVSIDKLLVLTFTEAAASEMKRKIADAINKKLDEDPDNKWLREQAIKVPSAAISTIHAFCSRIITNNAHLTDLPADFSLIENTENKLLQRQAVDTVMESYYSRIDKKDGFRQLVMGYSDVKNDENIRELVINLHNVSRSLAYPKKWFMDIHKGGYDVVSKTNDINASLWKNHLKDLVLEYYNDMCESMEKILSIIEKEIPKDHAFYGYYFDMCKTFLKETEALDVYDDEDFEKLCHIICDYKIKNSPKKNGVEDVEPRLSYLRNEYIKESIKSVTYLLSIEEENNLSRLSMCEPVAKSLCRLARLTERVHQKLKREKSVIDFNDLEHGMFKLIVDEKGRETSLCQKLRNHYQEILIDEFQDTNGLQFEIFKHISRNNLFMVGDIKQSIYKFRNADPSIFLSLYKKYKDGDEGHLICLSQNFRSRSQVVDCINDIFTSVMSERCGEIDYDGEEKLVCGAEYYPSGDGFETEVMVTDLSNTDIKDELIEELMTENVEARAVAERIKKLVCYDGFSVYDKDEDRMRAVRYGDVAVLCKTMKEKLAIEEELTELGIGSVTDGGQHYLTSVEVSTLLAFLQIIDNPIQDVPLIAVMRSAIFKFSVEELAKIRTYADGRFYYAVCDAAKADPKTAEFLDYLNELRDCAKYMGVDEIVRKICSDKQYFALVGAMTNGEIRKGNIKIFLEKCGSFEKGALKGLFNFIKYIEMIKLTDEDIIPAKDNKNEADSVKIMTVHKSKGLEFPVVVLYKTGKSINREELKNRIIFSEKTGLGLDYVDTRQRVKFPLPTREIVKRKMELSDIAEEMRLMYVAATRAKEKLIISATVTSRINNWKKTEHNENGKVLPCCALSSVSMRDWIFSALLNHPSGGYLRNFSDRFDIIPSLNTEGEFNVFGYEFSNSEKSEKSVAQERVFTGVDLEERLNYEYPYSHLAELPIKMSVSEVKRRQVSDDVFVKNLAAPESFDVEGEDISSAEKGTITHYVIQHIDEKKTDALSDVEEQIDSMVKKGIISIEQRSVVDAESIFKFFSSDIGVRLKNSLKVEREYDFYMLADYKDIDQNADTEFGDKVILQGISDCFFYEDDGVVLIDFKTDRVSNETADKRAEAYRMQMEYYEKGLSEILDRRVKEKYLYFLNCGKLIKM